ncbi:MAG: hypothetical protein ABII12_06510 [Planctomycetota bacterium]
MTQFACPRCGAEDLVPGRMHSTGAVHFRPADSKFLTFHTADIRLDVHMCTACGGVTLLGDAEKLRLIRGTPNTEQNFSQVVPDCS